MDRIKSVITAIFLIVCLLFSNIYVMASLGENELPPLIIDTEDTRNEVVEDTQGDVSADEPESDSANSESSTDTTIGNSGSTGSNSGSSGGGGGGSYIPSSKPIQQPTTPKPEVQESTETENNNKTFSDVNKDDWFYSDVMFVFNNKIMTGTSEDEFSPETVLNRAMMITILHRIDKDDSAYENDIFNDIEKNSWYENAVNWGFENKIVSGTSENTFSPMDNLTREQLCVMLYNYTKHIGAEAEFTDISSYSDKDAVSLWAKDAISWAVYEKIITGKGDNTLAPKDSATRAETAAVIRRYAEKFVEIEEK